MRRREWGRRRARVATRWWRPRLAALWWWRRRRASVPMISRLSAWWAARATTLRHAIALRGTLIALRAARAGTPQ